MESQLRCGDAKSVETFAKKHRHLLAVQRKVVLHKKSTMELVFVCQKLCCDNLKPCH